nr:hypothetical protein CFP56_27452 [Quercus suber]
MSSIAVAMFTLGTAVANLVGSLLVNIVDGVISKDGHESWLSNWISTHSDSTQFRNYASQVRDQVISSSLIPDPPVLAPISAQVLSKFSPQSSLSLSSFANFRLDSTHFQNYASQVGDQIFFSNGFSGHGNGLVIFPKILGMRQKTSKTSWDGYRFT